MIYGKYLEETKAISRFVRNWGTMNITDTNGVSHEVFLPSNFVWSEQSRSDLSDYPYELGGNTYKDGSIYRRGSNQAILDRQEADVTKYGNMRGYPRYGTRVRKLLDDLKAFDSIRTNNDIPKTNTTWLYLNPAKGISLNEAEVVQQLNDFIEKYQDEQGRVELKVRVILSNRYPIPNLPMRTAYDYEGYPVYDSLSLAIGNPTYKQEAVFRLNADGSKVMITEYQVDDKGKLVLDKNGNKIPTGRVYPAIDFENVVSYEGLQASLKARNYNNNAWDTYAQIPVVINDTVPEELPPDNVFGSVVAMTLAMSRGKYEKLLDYVVAWYADEFEFKSNDVIFNSITREKYPKINELENYGLRISAASTGVYTWTASGGGDTYLGGSYRNPDGSAVEYSGFNFQGDQYTVKYTVPTLDLTLVLRNPKVFEVNYDGEGNISAANTTPIIKRVLEAARKDWWVYESPAYDESGISGTGGRVLKLTSAGGYSVYTIVRNLYSDVDNPESTAPDVAANGSPAWQFSDIPQDSILRPDFWVVRYDYDWFYGRRAWYYLKKEVITTNKYIKKRSDRLKYVMSLVDSGYDVDDNGMSFWQGLIFFVVVIIAAVLAVFTGGASLAAIAVYFSLYISIASLILQNIAPEIATALAVMNKTMAPFVAVAGIVMMISGMANLYESISSAAEDAAVDAAESEFTASMAEAGYGGTSWATAEATSSLSSFVSNMVDKLVDAVKNEVNSVVNADTWTMLSKAAKVGNMAIDIYSKSELGKLEKDLKSKQDILSEQYAAMTAEKNNNMEMLMASLSVNPLMMQVAATELEYIYEPVVSQLNTGTTQWTKVVMMGTAAESFMKLG